MADASFAAAERAAWRLRLPGVGEAVLCTGIAAVAASLLVWLAPPGGDLAAHEYQRSLFLVHGFTLWDNFWYAGRYAFVGYSVLYYPLAALLGIRLLAVLTVAVAAGSFALLLEREWGAQARWASRAFALFWAGVFISAEFPFALGITLALLALVALQAGHRWRSAALTLLTLAASPVALVLLGVVLAGLALARRSTLRNGIVPALALGAAIVAELVILRLFPGTGHYPFPASEAGAALGFCALGLASTWRIERARILGFIFAAYAIVIVAVYLVPSQLGENVARFRYFALPLAVLVVGLRRWRPLPVALGVVALALSWNVTPLTASWARGDADLSSRAAMWKAPLEYLHANLRPGFRVEAVDTTDHWPAFYLAEARIPLVRGWFRQDDFPLAALLYRRISPTAYVRWLRKLGVAYVVLTRTPPDYSSRREAALVRSGRVGLSLVFATSKISIYAVPRARSIVTGPGHPKVLALRQSRLVVRVTRGGTYRVAVRWSPYWRASTGCLTRTSDGMVRLQTHAAATVRIAFDVDARSLFDAFAGTRRTCAS